ncbi:hypothetical protein BH10ACT3_BH10ACT3_23080 [soil metagenome]
MTGATPTGPAGPGSTARPKQNLTDYRPTPRNNVRRTDAPETPSVEQLDVSATRMFLRGSIGHCPVCGCGHLFTRWFTMAEDCPRCSFHFERVEGHWIGSLAVNTVLVMGLMFVVLMGVSLGNFPDAPPRALIFIEIGIAAICPFLFFPPSRTLWSAGDLLMRPLAAGEVDPAFVVVPPVAVAPRR